MATLDTHRAVTQLQDAGAPEPLAIATVEVVEEAASKLVMTSEDYLRAELHKQTATIGGMIVAVAAVAIAVMELLK